MSHQHLRREKNCLNCGATVADRYCSHCGQENTDPKETFRHLLRHFFDDVTHYDSHVFTSFKDLILKPGFLTRQYNAGKRASYLNPIRMYVFISAVFFLVLFSLNKESENKSEPVRKGHEVNLFRQHLADSLKNLRKTTLPLSVEDKAKNGVYTSISQKLDTPVINFAYNESLKVAFNNHVELVIQMEEHKYKTIAEYDIAQQKLPADKRDGAKDQYLTKKIIKLIAERGANGKAIVKQSLEHDIPKIMFLLLPIYAVFVGLFYNRKKYYYSQHAIFSLHFHSFLFLSFLVLYGISLFDPSLKVWEAIFGLFQLVIFVYLIAALHNVYRESILRSFFKAVGISMLYVLTILIVNLAVMAIVFTSI